jgi:hypothetical protein
MRNELEPNLVLAKKLFPKILNLIDEFNNSWGNYYENVEKYEELINEISKITGKEISRLRKYDDFSHGMYTLGEDRLAFDFALPAPIVVNDISKEELTEVVKRITVDRYKEEENDDFLKEINFDLWGYYFELLQINFYININDYTSYQNEETGEYIDYTPDEIANNILSIGHNIKEYIERMKIWLLENEIKYEIETINSLTFDKINDIKKDLILYINEETTAVKYNLPEEIIEYIKIEPV